MNKAAKISKTIIFLVLLIAAVVLVQGKFIPYEPQDTAQAKTFCDKTEKNSVDILIVGTSSIMVGISPLRIYEDAQITSHMRGNSRQPPQVMYLDVKEALKTQTPKLIVCSASMLTTDFDVDEEEVRLRRGMDYMPFSIDKMKVARTVTDESEWQTLSSYALPLLRYHTRWEEFAGENEDEEEPEEGSWDEYDFLHGQYTVYRTTRIKNVLDENMQITDPVEIVDSSWCWYEKVAALCSERDIPLLLVTMPDQRQTLGMHNSVAEAAEKLGADYLDYNYDGIYEKCGLDWLSDMYNDHHLNPRGALKATDYLVDFVVDRYGLTASDVPDTVKKQFEEDIDTFYEEYRQEGFD